MNILHLSDIHFGRNYPEYKQRDDFENKDRILEELIQCISHIEDKEHPEHVVVTGDIAWWGKRRDFEEAYEWFSKLLESIGLKGKDITFCVGNHDVNRSYISANRDLAIGENLCEDEITRIDNIYSYDRVHEMEPPIYEYDRFCKRIGMEPFRYPLKGEMEYSYSLGYKDVKFASGNTIRFLAFNTALLSCLPKIQQDKMWIGQKQVQSLIQYGVIPATDVYYSIALFHHPERFLHPNEICEYNARAATLPLLRDYVDLILCGHTETGGKPVLQQQIGGGKLLTGGAAYYSDRHPNAFSMLYITDIKKEICFVPYTYDGEWKNYEYGNHKVDIQGIRELPELGEIQECRFVISSQGKEYEIPLQKVSVCKIKKSGKLFVRLDNRKEVLRELDIKCEVAITGEGGTFEIELAPKMDRNVAAMLKIEECFNYLSEIFRNPEGTSARIINESGKEIFSVANIQGKIETDKEEIELLKKIVKIEEFYDVKFYKPDNIYERDLKRINVLIQLIDEGYTTEFQMGRKAATTFKDLDTMNKWYQRADKLNNFFLIYRQPFVCELFGVEFLLGEVTIIAGIYHIDKDDLLYKIETFKEGDFRKCIFNADEKFKTYFVSDEELAKEIVKFDSKAEAFSIGKIGMNFGYIYEKTSKE